MRREAGAGTGDQGGGARPPRGLNLSPRTVDAQVRLRSGRDNRGTSPPTGVGTTGAEKRPRKRRGQPTKSTYGLGINIFWEDPKERIEGSDLQFRLFKNIP